MLERTRELDGGTGSTSAVLSVGVIVVSAVLSVGVIVVRDLLLYVQCL